MARPAGEKEGFNLSPRARLIGGWLAAVLIVLVIAAAVRIFGGNADGTAVLPSASPSAGEQALAITFGTELDASRLVPAAARSSRFVPGDTFAYSVPDADPATTIYVAVDRVTSGAHQPVQQAVEAQAIPGGPATIGFTVPADALFEAWGPGTYEMRIHLDPDQPPIAEGRFELIDPDAPVPTPSADPQ